MQVWISPKSFSQVGNYLTQFYLVLQTEASIQKFASSFKLWSKGLCLSGINASLSGNDNSQNILEK